MHRNTKKRCGTNGFTLLEVMLSLAFIAVMSTLPFFFTRYLHTTNDLRLAEQIIVHGLREAQLFALAEKQDSTWGASIGGEGITLFQGNSYMARTEGSERVMPFPETVSISGLSEVIFEKFTGEPVNAGDIIINDGVTPRTIIVQPNGSLDY